MLTSSVFSKSVFWTFFLQICSYFPPTGQSTNGIAVGAVQLYQSFLTVSYAVSKTLSWNTGLGREVNE